MGRHIARHLAGLLALLAIMAVGCGGSSGAEAACTEGTGTSQTCIEYSASGGSANASSFDQIKTACTQGGGTASNTCPRTGADGGCRMTQSGNGVSVSITTWTYSGNAASEMQSCTSNGGTWIAP